MTLDDIYTYDEERGVGVYHWDRLSSTAYLTIVVPGDGTRGRWECRRGSLDEVEAEARAVFKARGQSAFGNPYVAVRDDARPGWQIWIS